MFLKERERIMLSNRLVKHFGAAAAAAVVVGSANAAIVTWNINAVIPANIDGLYINIAAQTTGTSATGQNPCHDWSFGPREGDRWRKYRGREQAELHPSYKGSIPAHPRR